LSTVGAQSENVVAFACIRNLNYQALSPAPVGAGPRHCSSN